MQRSLGVLALVAVLASGGRGQERPRVLLIGGGEDAVRERALLRLKHGLEGSGRFEVRLTQDPPASLDRYDAVLLDGSSGEPGRDLMRFVQSGRGLVVLRTGAGTPPSARALRLEWINSEHPISAGLESVFQTIDRPRSVKPPARATVLAATRGEDPQPVAWVISEGKGRVLETVLGEDPALVEEPAFLNLVRRGLEWAATGRVTLEPVARGLASPGKSVRVLIVTGGHGHEVSFYEMFNDSPNITANVDPHPMPYRRGDLRERYDVLVLYDSMQEMTDTERKRLQDFVEAGKGIVVLHHALVDYCNWKWWYEEVVGGRWYQTEDTPPRWKTTWKDDVELLVYPTAEHPVLEGVAPMHLRDETYKGMWLSPDNKVLMRTDDPSSDGPVVWISPYRRSRVVVIELGHDHNAHLHPGYRRLVTNAILWSAGAE